MKIQIGVKYAECIQNTLWYYSKIIFLTDFCLKGINDGYEHHCKL